MAGAAFDLRCPRGGSRQLLENAFVRREVRVPAVLVPEQPVAGLDDEVTSAAGNDLDVGARVLVANRGSQTGRLRFVVSNDAVLDGDVHAPSLALCQIGSNARSRQCRIPALPVSGAAMPESGIAG